MFLQYRYQYRCRGS